MLWAVVALIYFTDGFSDSAGLGDLALAALVAAPPMICVAIGWFFANRRTD